jgi:type VI secretion system VgrG family protein
LPTLTARIETAGIEPGKVEVAWVKGREELSHLYALQIRIIGAAGVLLDEDSLLGEPARLVFESDGEAVRLVHGIIQRIESDVHAESGALAWDLLLAPRAFALTLGEVTEITMESSVPSIVAERLSRAGLREGKDFELSLRATYDPREFVVQFKESHAAFVSRLTEHLGVTFYFRQTDDRELWAFADANEGMTTEHDGLRIPFRPRGERMDVFELRAISNVVSAKVAVRDYNYRTPGVKLSETQATESKWGEHFEYGVHFKTPPEAQALAKVRAEELACRRKVFHGKSARPELSPGSRITIEGHPSGDKKLLITSVEHSLVQSAFGTTDSRAGAYENSFTAIDVATPFRPPRRTAKPFVPGVLTAVVETAQAGEYSEVDEEGRYRVRFAFERSDAEHGKASRPIRMAQPHAGAGYGFHFPLRDGVEVLITCVEGDPDRPIISGAIPNPATPSTVAEKNATRNVIRTGGGTEINIDDTAGSERMKISVPFANTVLQLGAPNQPSPGIFFGTDKDVKYTLARIPLRRWTRTRAARSKETAASMSWATAPSFAPIGLSRSRGCSRSARRSSCSVPASMRT